MDYGIAELSALLGLIISGIVFYLLASVITGSGLNLDSFLLADRELTPKQFENTFVASSLSLATVFLFFLANIDIYGLWLLACGVSYFIGQLALVTVATRVPLTFSDNHTAADLVNREIGSKWVARLITAITVSSLIAMVFIELYFGAIILAIFIPENLYARTLSYLGVGILVLAYLRVGGYKAIVETDTWQLALIILAITSIGVAGWALPEVSSTEVSNPLRAEASQFELLSFVVWISFLNLALPFSEVPYWQRVVAVKPQKAALPATIKASWKFAVAWIAPVLILAYLATKGYQFSDLRGFLDTLQTGPTYVGTILYPLTVVGLASALFSTIDSRLMGVVLSLADSVTFRSSLEDKTEPELKKRLTQFVGALLLVLTSMYFIAYYNLFDLFIPLIYAMFGPLTAVAPVVVYAIWSKSGERNGDEFSVATIVSHVTDGPYWILALGLILGWIINIGSVFMNELQNTQMWSQWAAPIGAFVVVLCVVIYHWCATGTSIKAEERG